MPHTWRKTEIGILQFFERLGLDTRRIFLFWSVAIGAVCGLVAVSFHLLIRAVTEFLFGAPDFAGVIRTPMTSVLIIFEMTQDYHIILPLMVANLVSLRLSTWLHPKGDVRKPLSSGRGPSAHAPYALHPREHPRGGRHGEGGHQARGPSDRRGGHQKTPIRELGIRTYVAHAHPDHTLDVVLHKLGSRDISRLPVVNRVNPKVIEGIITAEDVMHTFGVHRDIHEEGDVDEPVKSPWQPPVASR